MSSANLNTRIRKRQEVDDDVIPVIDNSDKSFRELFVGSIGTSNASEYVVLSFFNRAMRAAGLCLREGDPIIACRLHEKYSFIEFRSDEECTNGMNMNGIPYMNNMLRIRRPEKYSGQFPVGKTWQEFTAGKDINFDMTTKDVNATVVLLRPLPEVDPDTFNTREIFIGNTTESMTPQLLLDFFNGVLQCLGLSNSDEEDPVMSVELQGRFAYAEMRTSEDAANIMNFNHVPFFKQNLQIKRPAKFSGFKEMPHYQYDDILRMWQNGELKKITAGPVSSVICISHVVTSLNELNDHVSFNRVMEDIRAECSTHGQILKVYIPRPKDNPIYKNCVGKVFVQYSLEQSAIQAMLQLKGVKYVNRFIDVKFYPLEYFLKHDYEYQPDPLIVIKNGTTILRNYLISNE